VSAYTEAEQAAILLAVMSYKYFHSPPQDTEWHQWRRDGNLWIKKWEGSAIQRETQGLMDTIEDLLEDLELLTLDEATSTYEDLPEDTDSAEFIVPQDHNVVEPEAGNLSELAYDTVVDMPDNTDLVCDFCTIAIASKYVEHLGAHFCDACYWHNRDLTHDHHTPDRGPKQEDNEAGRTKPVAELAAAGEGAPKGRRVGESNARSWEAFAHAGG
jgi:hypothetical protein